MIIKEEYISYNRDIDMYKDFNNFGLLLFIIIIVVFLYTRKKNNYLKSVK